MTKPSAGEVIELHLDNKFWLKRLHSIECFVLQRLNPPGALPVKPSGFTSFSNLFVNG